MQNTYFEDICTRGWLTECSSWSIVWAKTGLKDTGERAPGFFLTALIWSKALKAGEESTGSSDLTLFFQTELLNRGVTAALTQPADRTVVGLVTQRVRAGVAEAQVSAGQDECVSQVRQTHNTLAAVVTVLIIWRLEGKERKATQTQTHTWGGRVGGNRCLQQQGVRL